MTADLGVRTLRVFAGWPGVTNLTGGGELRPPRAASGAKLTWKCPRNAPREACRDGLIEAARWAGDAGVTLALQNHAPITNNPADTLRMIHEVASPHVKACLDAPMAARQGVAAGEPMRQAALSVARAASALALRRRVRAPVRRRDPGLTSANPT